MRRFVPLALAGLMVIVLSVSAWAAGGPPASPPGQERAQEFQQAMNGMRNHLQEMHQHRITIRAMQGEIKGLTVQIRAEVRRIRQNGLTLTEEQLEEIRDVTARMRGFGESIAETMGQINEQAALLRQARTELESGPVINAFERIQAVQEARLSHLEALATAMNDLLADLQAIQ